MRRIPSSAAVFPTSAIVHGDLAFRSIVQATADKAGEEFLCALVQHLALHLDVGYAFVAEFCGSPSRVRTVALWGQGEWLDNIEYDLDGTPCEEVLHGSLCFHPDSVQARFPNDTLLTEMGALSYLGVPLRSMSGETLGHLAVIDTRPLPPDARFQDVFRIFADRARVELERMRADYILQQASRDLESRLERTQSDLKLARDELAALLDVNRAVARHLRRDELFAALSRCLRGVMPADRFGIELALPGGRLRAHLFAPLTGVPGPVVVKELEARGTACHWVEENQQWLVAATRDELRELYPITYEVMNQERMESLCAMPLVIDDRSIGVLFFMAAEKAAYGKLRRDLLDEVAGAVAVALDNCLAYEELQELRDRLARENVYLQEEIRQEHNFEEIVGRSPELLRVLAEIETVAETDSTVVILGETGTGKELIARALHDRSRRRDRPLVKVNCSAISAGLVESELFGHVKGAFTGAVSDRTGRFDLADGGTIFLDEIGELPLETQVKLLRVLQEREFEPVGSSRSRKVDVRVIAATNRDLNEAVATGVMRADLFYRLHVLPISVPPLRERRSDIPLLAQYFVERFSRDLGKCIEGISQDAMKGLMAYDWPGNIRELQNLIERVVVLAQGPVIDEIPGLLPGTKPIERPPSSPSPAASQPASGNGGGSLGTGTLHEVERGHVLAVLEQCGWTIDGTGGAASRLGLPPSTLRSRMKKMGLRRPAARE